MNVKMAALEYGLKPVNEFGKRYYPNQKDCLDQLREDKYGLIVFDALRYDYAKEILPLYLKGNLRPVWSAAHDTFEYGHLCWGDRIYHDHYISGAVPFNTTQDFDQEHFNQLYGGWEPENTLPNLVEAWEDAWDEGLGTADPETMTQVASNYTDKRKLVTHYFQPHAPHIGRVAHLGHTNNQDAKPHNGEPVDKPMWDKVKTGETTVSELRQGYRANIHRAVEAALPLLRELCNQDRRVVVMADHGELLGRYDTRLISHPRLSFPEIRKVPWMEVDGVREFPDPDTTVDGDVAEKLQALGYRE